MFKIFKKKEKPQPKVIMHPELGELEFGVLSWRSVSTVELSLWDKTYDVRLEFFTSEDEEPTLQQVEAYRKYKSIAADQRDEIEKMIMEYAGEEDMQKAGSRMIPRDVVFSRKGECALIFEDEDTEEEMPYGYDSDYGVALFLLPQFLVNSTEDTLDCMMELGRYS